MHVAAIWRCSQQAQHTCHGFVPNMNNKAAVVFCHCLEQQTGFAASLNWASSAVLHCLTKSAANLSSFFSLGISHKVL